MDNPPNQQEYIHSEEPVLNKESNSNFLEQIKEDWLKQTNIIKESIDSTDKRDWIKKEKDFRVGGLDISYIVGDDETACSCYVVLDSKFQLLYHKTEIVKMTAPYIPGFLAFREADFLCRLVEEQTRELPEVRPEVLLVDGNGVLHPYRAGVACHIGVRLKIPTIGVAKNLHRLPELGEVTRKEIAMHLKVKGDTFDLRAETGEILGRAVRTAESGFNPVFVSVGTGLSLDSAVHLVLQFSKFRIPEPTRQADMLSREYLRIHHPTARQIQPVRNKVKSKICNQKNLADRSVFTDSETGAACTLDAERTN